MKDIRNEIIDFVSIDNQEVTDKNLALDCIDKFEDVFTRENKLIHFVTSALVLNKNRDKVLMIFHNIFKSWGWIGGHADGDRDLFAVIKREIFEETGINGAVSLNDGIFSLEALPVVSHFKNGKYVSSHTHISIDYIFEADEKESLFVNSDENSGVRWVPIEKVVSLSTEPHMQLIYKKVINKLINLELS